MREVRKDIRLRCGCSANESGLMLYCLYIERVVGGCAVLYICMEIEKKEVG